VLSGLIAYPFAEAKSVITQFARLTETMPDELNVWMVTRKAPPLPFLASEVHGKEIVVLAICHAGDPATGEKLIEPLRGFGTLLGEHVGVQPYVAWQQAFDPLLAKGARNYWKSHNFSRLSEGAIDAIVEYASKLPSPHCEIFIGTIGGQTTRVAPDAMAYSSRDANYVMNVHGRWETAAEDENVIRWAREFFARSRPFSSGGAYINFMTEEESDRVASAYGPAYNRLVDRHARDGAAHDVERQVFQCLEADAAFAHVEAFSTLLIFVDEPIGERRMIVEGRAMQNQARFL
jgi:hypothetical protein